MSVNFGNSSEVKAVPLTAPPNSPEGSSCGLDEHLQFLTSFRDLQITARTLSGSSIGECAMRHLQPHVALFNRGSYLEVMESLKGVPIIECIPSLEPLILEKLRGSEQLNIWFLRLVIMLALADTREEIPYLRSLDNRLSQQFVGVSNFLGPLDRPKDFLSKCLANDCSNLLKHYERYLEHVIPEIVSQENVLYFQKLIHYGFANIRMQDGKTIAHVACCYRKKIILEEILQKSPGLVHVEDDKGEQAIHVAAYLGEKEIVEMLLRFGANPMASARGTHPIHKASLRGDPEMLEFFRKYYTGIDVVDAQGSTPFHFAAMIGSTRVVKYLEAQGADGNKKNYRGLTPHDVFKRTFQRRP